MLEKELLVLLGCCKDMGLWKWFFLLKGIYIMYGIEEVFVLEIEDFIGIVQEMVVVKSEVVVGGIYVWFVVLLFFLSNVNE